MPDWRYNVLSTSEAYINTDGVALDPLAASYPRRADRTRPQHTCPYTTIFLGARSHHSPFRQPQSDSADPYADVYSVDRSSNLTDTSSFARYEDCRPLGDTPQISLEESDLTVQKVPYNASSVFFISAKSESQKDAQQSNNVFVVEGSDSDALSSCTCDSFERCEFDCRDFEPFSDTCCCDPLSDGVCSRSPKNVESPENFCDRVVDEDCVSARSDMDGLDLTLFEPAQTNECEGVDSNNAASVPSSLCGILHALPENSTGKSCLICPRRALRNKFAISSITAIRNIAPRWLASIGLVSDTSNGRGKLLSHQSHIIVIPASSNNAGNEEGDRNRVVTGYNDVRDGTITSCWYIS